MTDPSVFRTACQAMNSRFELVLCGEDEGVLRSIGQEVCDEIHALDRQLSHFSHQSEISAINRFAADREVTVEPQLFSLLTLCKELWVLTGGSFDPTIGPVMQAWGWKKKQGRVPSRDELVDALERVGMDKVSLNPARRTIFFSVKGMSIDLGAIGKGYALDRGAELLREYSIESALLHGGASSILTIGTPPEQSSWKVAIPHPLQTGTQIGTVDLRGNCLGVSGNHLNYFTQDGHRYGHILDPRTGEPVQDSVLSLVMCGSATEADALSTALLCDSRQVARWKERVDGACWAWLEGEELRLKGLGTLASLTSSAPLGS